MSRQAEAADAGAVSVPGKPPVLDTVYRGVVSVFVGFVLIFQAIISLGPVVGFKINTAYWPLLPYAMYSRSFQEGDRIEIYRIMEGVSSDGERVEISMESMGLHVYHYRNLVRDLEAGTPEAFDYLFERLPPGTRIDSIRVLSFPIAVTRDGPVEKGSELLGVIEVPQRWREAAL